MKINNNNNVKHLDQDLINITFETSQGIEKLKKHPFIFKVTILGSKRCLLFITLFYSYLMTSISEIKLCELFGLTQSI